MLLFALQIHAQQKDTALKKRDTSGNKTILQHKKDTVKKNRTDTVVKKLNARVTDSIKKDSIKEVVITPRTIVNIPAQPDTVAIVDSAKQVFPILKKGKSVSDKILSGNRFINTKDAAQYFIISERQPVGKEFLFYSICGLLLLLGFFKTFYSHYFSNLFRVYFNTSLRQTQLSEQLLQAKLPSFLLNIFFIIVTGVFLWQMFLHFNDTSRVTPLLLLQLCIGAVAVIYLVKYCFLKFIGWTAGISEVMDHYIFIIFMINKLLGILLLPFVILLAFASADWLGTVKTIALLSISILFLSRYAKSYGLLGQKISIKPFHFILFFIGAEIIPLALLYKASIDYFIR